MDTQNDPDPQSQEQAPVIDFTGDTPDSEDEEQYFVRLDRRKYAEELARLEKEDKDFGNVFHARIGSRAAEKWQPQLRQRELELEEARLQARHARLASMPDAEVQQRFNNDPDFRREWTDYLNHNPAELEVRKAQAKVTDELEGIWRRAAQRGLPENKLAEFKDALSKGRYDKDEDGRDLDISSGLIRLQEELHDAILETVTTRPSADEDDSPAPSRRTAQIEAPQVNPVLARGGPDNTSSNGRIGKKPSFKTWKEAAALFSEDKIDAETYERAKATLPYD